MREGLSDIRYCPLSGLSHIRAAAPELKERQTPDEGGIVESWGYLALFDGTIHNTELTSEHTFDRHAP